MENNLLGKLVNESSLYNRWYSRDKRNTNSSGPALCGQLRPKNLSAAVDFCLVYYTLVYVSTLDRFYRLAFAMLSEIPDAEFDAALDACAAEVLWESGMIEPPIDALEVAERLGLVVARDFAMPYRGRFVRLAAREERGGQATIVVGQAERPEREQWAVAHEIGECVAFRVFERLGISFDETLPPSRELVANRLASSLLLPRRWFANDGRDLDWDLFSLKDRYVTASHELIARRMLEMRPLIVITVCDLGRIHWRRSNVTARPPAMSPDEKAAWQETHHTGLPSQAMLDTETGLDLVRCWPIHEPGWKREILRSEIAEI